MTSVRGDDENHDPVHRAGRDRPSPSREGLRAQSCGRTCHRPHKSFSETSRLRRLFSWLFLQCLSYFSFLLIVKYLILLTLNILASTVIASLTWAAFLYITTVLSLASFAQILLPAVPLVPVPGCSDGEMYSSPCLGLRCQHFVVGSRTWIIII